MDEVWRSTQRRAHHENPLCHLRVPACMCACHGSFEYRRQRTCFQSQSLSQGTHLVSSLHRRSRDRLLDQLRSSLSRSQRRTQPTPTRTPGSLTRTKRDVSPRSSVWSTSRTSTSSTSSGSTCQHLLIHARAVVRRLSSLIGTYSVALSSSAAGSGSVVEMVLTVAEAGIN